MRAEFKLTNKELKDLLSACEPVRYLVVNGIGPTPPQENANRAWKRLGEKLGFLWDSVEPISGKGNAFFTALEMEVVTNETAN